LPEPPTQVDASGARGDEKKRQRAAAGAAGTILTGTQGLGGGANTGRTLLGS